jgi:PIN domain nuclease of toxin-antitoxin system
VRKGRLQLDVSVAEWTDQILSIPKVECLALDERVALRAEELPMHPDPADRFIVATAIEHRARLVTKDPALRRLKAIDTVW